MTLIIVMHVFELFVRNIYQSKVVSTVSDLIGCNEKKIPTATIVWWIPKIYTWNFVVNCLYPNNNGMLSPRGTTCLITWHKCKGFRFSAPGCLNSKLQQKMQTQWCPISNVQLLKKGRDMPTVRIMLTSTNGRFRKLCKISKTAGEWGSNVGTKLPYFVDSLNSRSRSEILDKSNTFRSSLTKCTIVSIMNI